MSETTHTCAIGGCQAQIPTSDPICSGHREQLSPENGHQLLVSKIDLLFMRRERGYAGAALKFAEVIAEATAALRTDPKQLEIPGS